MSGKILVVAGEASADLHASAVVKRLKKQEPEIDVYGVGGKHLKEAGARIWFDFSSIGVVGVWEVLPKLKYFLDARKQLLESIEKEKPDLVLLLDLPDFNLSLAKKIKEINPSQKIVYYISPQIWAWRRWRVRAVKKYIDLMLVIFPFEVEFYQSAGVPVKFVGHPLLERIHPSQSREELRKKFQVGTKQILLAFLPGSRKEELRLYLPRSLPALERLKKEFGIKIILARAPTLEQEFLEKYLSHYPEILEIISGEVYDLLFASDLALVGSGTATLETALAGVPMVILARTSWLNYLLVRPLVHTPFYGLPNLIAGKEIAVELVMGAVNSRRIYQELSRFLLSSEQREQAKKELEQIQNKLGEKKASQEVAEQILSLLSH